MPVMRNKRMKSFDEAAERLSELDEMIAQIEELKRDAARQQKDMLSDVLVEVFPEVETGEYEGSLSDWLKSVRKAWEQSGKDGTKRDGDKPSDEKPAPSQPQNQSPSNPFAR